MQGWGMQGQRCSGEATLARVLSARVSKYQVEGLARVAGDERRGDGSERTNQTIGSLRERARQVPPRRQKGTAARQARRARPACGTCREVLPASAVKYHCSQYVVGGSSTCSDACTL